MILPDIYSVELETLKHTNPLLCMPSIYAETDGHRVIPESDPSYKNKNLALNLTLVKIIEESDKKKNKETLKTVCDAVSDGVLLSSSKYIWRNKSLLSVCFYPEFGKPISIFASAIIIIRKPSFFNLSIFPDDYRRDYFSKVDKKRLWMKAVFQGHRERQENFDCMSNELVDYVRDCRSKTEVPKGVMDIIVSCLSEYHINKENAALIRQAKKEFNEEQLELDRFRPLPVVQLSQLHLNEEQQSQHILIKNRICKPTSTKQVAIVKKLQEMEME